MLLILKYFMLACFAYVIIRIVNHMEKLKEFLMEYKVSADTADIDHLLKGYNDSQKKAVEEQNKLLAKVIYHVKKSIVFPKWAIKLFWGLW